MPAASDATPPMGRRPAACIVRHAYYPDTHVRRDAETLVRQGWDVSVVALCRPGQPRRETLGGVEVYRLPVRHVRGSALRYLWEYAAFLTLALVAVGILHARKRFRVVEVDNMPDVLVFSALVPKLFGARVLLYIFDNMPELLRVTRGVGPHHPAVRLLALLERVSTGFADAVLVTQHTAEQILRQRGVPAGKIAVVLNCPDEAVFSRIGAPGAVDAVDAGGAESVTGDVGSPPPQTNRSGGFEIVTHGAMLERYGVQVLIDALPKVLAVVPEARVEVFGEGEYLRTLSESAALNGVQHRVTFRGLVPLDELIRCLSRAHLGYAGMLCDNMLSNKLMEYVALGVPVAAARWPTFERYFPEDSVAYFQPGSSDALAQAIVGVFRAPNLARERAARASALYERYRWTEQQRVYLDAYQRLLGSATGRSGRPEPAVAARPI